MQKNRNSIRNYWFNLLSIITMMIVLSSCSNGQVQNTQEVLPANEFSTKIKEVPSAPILDVRTAKEFSRGYLQNAKNIDWNGEDFEKQVLQMDMSSPVFVYCLSGARSSSAASAMRSLGFKEVYEMDGGIIQWRRAGLPEVTGTSTIHKGMTKQQFSTLLKTDQLVLIDFYAEWCAPCKKMEPYLEEMTTEMKDSVLIVRLNIDDNQSLSNELKVSALPTLLLYKDRKLIWSYTGYIRKEDLVKQFK